MVCAKGKIQVYIPNGQTRGDSPEAAWVATKMCVLVRTYAPFATQNWSRGPLDVKKPSM